MNLLVIIVCIFGFMFTGRMLFKNWHLDSENPRLKYIYLLLCLFWLTLLLSAVFRNNYLLITSFAFLITHWFYRRYSLRKSIDELKNLSDEVRVPDVAENEITETETIGNVEDVTDLKDQEYMEIATAIVGGNLDLAKSKIASGFDVNYISTDTDSQLLSLLLQQGQGELMLKLTEKVVSNPKYTAEEHEEHRTVIEQHGKLEQGCLLLLSLGAEINANDVNGRSNIMLAAKHGFNSVLEELIRLGADVDCQKNNGATALHEAVWARAVKSTSLLISAGAATGIADREGKVPFDYAKDDDIIELLKHS